MSEKTTVAEIASTCAIIGILALMVILVLGLDNTARDLENRLDKIQESLTSKAVARTAVIHGYYYDLEHPEKSGLRMIRVTKDGTLAVMPIPMPTQEKEKSDAPAK